MPECRTQGESNLQILLAALNSNLPIIVFAYFCYNTATYFAHMRFFHHYTSAHARRKNFLQLKVAKHESKPHSSLPVKK